QSQKGKSDNFKVVSQANPTLTTQASGSVVVGGAISDTATLSGGNNPTGSITFTLTDPSNNTVTVPPNATVSGNGAYNSGTYTANAAGTYTWHAVYSGDTGNLGASDGGANESVVVTQASPKLNTTASAAVEVGGS